MVYYGTYQGSVSDSLRGLWVSVVAYLPNVIIAAIVLIVGWVVSIFLAKLVFKILEIIKIDYVANRVGLNELSSRIGRKLSIARFGEWLVKWFFIIATLIAAADILGLSQVSAFLYGKVFPYFGNVLVAAFILLIGIVVADFLTGLVRSSLHAGGFSKGANAIAAVVKYAILVFTIFAALVQLNVASEILQDIVVGVIAMLSIAGGLAFGLGGRDHAKKVLDFIEGEIKSGQR